MRRQGLSRLRPLRKFLFPSSSSSSACSHSSPSPVPSSSSFLNSNFHHSHESTESPLRFGLGHASGSSVSAPFGNRRTFSAARMESERISGAVVVTGEEAIGSDNKFRSGVGLSEEEGAVEFGKEAELVSDSSEDEHEEEEEERFSCEGVDEGVLEDAEPHADPEGRRYLHVLTVAEVQAVLEKTRADDVQVIPVRDLCEWADHLVVASGHSSRHLRGIADAICFEVKKRSTNVGDNVYPTVEGRESEEWMVVDCGSIVVHVFRDDIRGEYNLEEMWRKRRPANIKNIGI